MKHLILKVKRERDAMRESMAR